MYRSNGAYLGTEQDRERPSYRMPQIEHGNRAKDHSHTRIRLQRLYERLPRGSKGSLARVCGLSTHRHLKALARFNAYLFPTVAARIERVLDDIEMGRLVMVDSGRLHAGTRVILWQRLNPR